MARRSRLLPETGQLHAAPLRDGTVGLVQVAFAEKIGLRAHTVALAFFDLRAPDVTRLSAAVVDAPLDRPFTVLSPSSTPVQDGQLQPIGSAPTQYVNVDVEANLHGPYRWFGGKERAWPYVLDMWYGLYPWDGLHDPRWLEAQLLPGWGRPPTARLRSDFTADELTALGIRPT